MVAEWSDCSTNSSSAAEKLTSVLHDVSPRSSSCSNCPFKEQSAEAQIKLLCNGTTEHQHSVEVSRGVTIAQSDLDEKLCLISSQNHDFMLSSSLSTLAVVDGYQDVMVMCDGHSLAAHRLVLAAASPFLKAVLQSMANDQPACVTIVGVKWPILCHVMQYIYIGQAYVQQEDVAEVIAAGQSLGICGLKDLHEYLLEHQKNSSRDPSSNGPEKDEDNENSKVVQEFNGINEHLVNVLPVANVTKAGKNKNEECKPVARELSNGRCHDPYSMTTHFLASELNLGQKGGQLPRCQSSVRENEQILSESQPNSGASIQNIYTSRSASEDPAEGLAQFSSEPIIENKYKNPESAEVWTGSCVVSAHKRLKLSNPIYYHSGKQTLHNEKNNPEFHADINNLPVEALEVRNYVSQASQLDNMPLSIRKPASIGSTPPNRRNVHLPEKSDISTASIERYTNVPLATEQNASRVNASCASSSSRYFNDVEIRPVEAKPWLPEGVSDAFIPSTSQQHQDLSYQPPAHLASSGHYAATSSETWKDKFTADTFVSNAQPCGVDGNAIGKLLSALAAQRMPGRVEQQEAAVRMDTSSCGAGLSGMESSNGGSHHDLLKSEKPSFTREGAISAQVLSHLSSDGTLSGDITSRRDKMSTGTSNLEPALTDSSAPPLTPSSSVTPVPTYKFATQEEIDIVLDQYQRKLAFHEPRPCPCCGRMYRDAATLRTHLGIMHTPGSEPFVCSCGAQFKTKYEMHHHKKNGHYLTVAPHT